MKSRNDPYSSLEKALRILISFTPLNQEKGSGEISQKMGLHASTVSRQMKVLAKYGLLQYNSRSKKYSLGKTCMDLGWTLRQTVRNKIVIIAQPFIDGLRDSLGKGVGMEVFFGDSTIVAYRSLGPQFPNNRIKFNMGERMPVHIAAGAKAIMAFLPMEVVNNLIAGELPKRTPKTITDPDLLKKKLVQYKKEGVAYDTGESDIDKQFAAAPIFDYEKNPVAAIVIGAPFHEGKAGFDPKEIKLLKETAAKISYALHYREESEP